MQSAAGGTIQRLKAGLATEWFRSKIDATLMERISPVLDLFPSRAVRIRAPGRGGR